VPLDSNVYNYGYTLSVDTSLGQALDTHLLAEHVLQPIHDGAIDKIARSPDWVLGVLVVIFLLLAWVRIYHLKRLNQLLQAFLYKLHVYTLLRSNDSMLKRINWGLNAIFVLTMSLFLYQFIEHYGVKLPFVETMNSFLVIVPLLLLLYPVKSLVLQLSGWIFNDSEKITEYIFNIFLINKVLGLFLVPIVVLAAYLSFGQAMLLHVGVMLVVLCYIYRLFRGYFIGRSAANLSGFYILLYLCTLEILPLIIIAKFVSSEL